MTQGRCIREWDGAQVRARLQTLETSTPGVKKKKEKTLQIKLREPIKHLLEQAHQPRRSRVGVVRKQPHTRATCLANG